MSNISQYRRLNVPALQAELRLKRAAVPTGIPIDCYDEVGREFGIDGAVIRAMATSAGAEKRAAAQRLCDDYRAIRSPESRAERIASALAYDRKYQARRFAGAMQLGKAILGTVVLITLYAYFLAPLATAWANWLPIAW